PRRAPPPPPGSAADGAGAPRLGASGRLLVVEDDYFVGLTIEGALAEAGHEVIGLVTSGEEAVDAALARRPDLVLMDIRLAGEMSGVEAALQLRGHGIACLFASAHSDAATRAAGAQAQPAGWLVKPFSQAELIAAVADALAGVRGG
ncbi:MAG: response regulator, partial [Pseudomonadota bacterium]|nr:response regulator [Pseudomonadota bacterium]